MTAINKNECLSNSMCYYAAESVTEEIMEIYSVIQSINDEECYQNPSYNLNTVFQRKIEVEHAKAIIKSRDPWKTLKNFAYIPNYLQLAKTEYQGSPLKPGDHVLFLGSGPLPISLIILCRLYGLRGIGIEQEPDRAELSRMVLRKLGFSDQVRIIEGNHFSLPLEEKSELIMVAAQAEPKKAIFDQKRRSLIIWQRCCQRVQKYPIESMRKGLDDCWTHFHVMNCLNRL
jgi:hypothetical protein